MKIFLTFIVFLAFCLQPLFVSASWNEYKDIEFKNLLFYEGIGEEIIIRNKIGVGTGHYVEQMRIFVDEGRELKLIFSIKTHDEHIRSGFFPDEHVVFISDINFVNMNKKGQADIIVKVTKYNLEVKYEENKDGKREKSRFLWSGKVLKEKSLGEMIFKWNGEHYELEGKLPPLLEQKYKYEEERWQEIVGQGEVVGDNIYFK